MGRGVGTVGIGGRRDQLVAGGDGIWRGLLMLLLLLVYGLTLPGALDLDLGGVVLEDGGGNGGGLLRQQRQVKVVRIG